MNEKLNTDEPVGPSDQPDSPVAEAKNSDHCCTYQGRWYKAGAIICRGGKKHECMKDGRWVNLGTKCP